MELVIWRDKVDTTQLHFGRMSFRDTEAVMVTFLFSLFEDDIEGVFRLQPDALKNITGAPTPIELTLFVK